MLNFGNRDTEFPVPNSAARVHGVPEVKRKKKIDKLIVAMPLPKQGKKIYFVAIVAMSLPKMGGKKKLVVAEIWGGIKKKKCATSTIFLQHFHNKSQVFSYYQFKFEFNTEITFLIQQ